MTDEAVRGVPAEQAVAMLSKVFIAMAIAFGTALITCLSVLPVASTTPVLVDLYVMVARFSLSGLIGAFLWYLPLVWHVRLAPQPGWRKVLRWTLSAISVTGAATIVIVLVRILINGAKLLGVIADRLGTLP